MPKVFILNRGSHDYSQAARFGELTYISDGMLDKLSTGVMFRILQEAFKNSCPEDYILLSSLTTLCSIATAMFSSMHGCVNLLIFHQDNYVVRRVSFSQLYKDCKNEPSLLR